MEISPFKRSSAKEDLYCCKENQPETIRPNPNPNIFSIKKIYSYKSMILVWVHYPDCTNYEGDKILLLERPIYNIRVAGGRLDPHFFKGSGLIARLVPTNEGWILGKKLMYVL